MKTVSTALVLLATLALSPSAMAQETQRTEYTVNIAVPDNNPAGISSTRLFTSNLTNILDLNVTLEIQGNYNGDLTGYITHESGMAVLFNRVGKTVDNPFGYSDAGMRLTLDDGAANGDIHNYRATLGLDPASGALSGPLTGSWAPDGRDVDPANVVDTDPRTATLESFNGLDPNGEWTIFLADVSPGGTSSLVSWGLEVTGIPEPASSLLFALGGFGLLLAWRSWARRS